MQWFYDNQLKRYITQLIRMFSNFNYKNGYGDIIQVPILYGDLSRQVGVLLRDNSENKIPSAPRMALYITSLELDMTRMADPTFISKVNVKERKISEDGSQYLDTEGRNYTVERLMPSPYTLGVNLDVWSTNTDQKLQILEQILMLFNPSLEFQSTDNFIDWISVSVVYLNNITWSSRTIPSGTETEIDVATLSFTLPIYISPPVKVTRTNVIHDIITRVQSEITNIEEVNIDTQLSTLFELDDEGNLKEMKTTQSDNDNDSSNQPISNSIKTNFENTTLIIEDNTARFSKFSNSKFLSWHSLFAGIKDPFEPGVSQLRLKRHDHPYEIVGVMYIDENDETLVHVSWDTDTFPEDLIIVGPSGQKNKIDYIIDPTRTNPNILNLAKNPRILILEDIGSDINSKGPLAWQNQDGSYFYAGKNDIIEWDGSSWNIVYDASQNLCNYENSYEHILYTSNLNTGTQYKFQNGEWVLSIDGDYPPGTWRVVL